MTPEESKRISKENEKRFQDAYSRWEASGKVSKKDWDVMWWCVDLACNNIAKKMLVGITVDPEEFEDRVMQSVCYVMGFIKERSVHPDRLSSYCYLRVKKFLQSPQNQFYDSLQALPEYETTNIREVDYYD